MKPSDLQDCPNPTPFLKCAVCPARKASDSAGNTGSGQAWAELCLAIAHMPKTLWAFLCLLMALRSLLGSLLPGSVWWGILFQASGEQHAFSTAGFTKVSVISLLLSTTVVSRIAGMLLRGTSVILFRSHMLLELGS